MRIANIAGAVVMERVDESDQLANGPDGAAAIIRSCCDSAGLSPDQLDAIVVSVPGSYDIATDALSYVDHLSGWQHPSVGAELRMLFPNATVSLENDVNLVALAEHRAPRRSMESFFLLWLDEGIGGALMMDGSLFPRQPGRRGRSGLSPHPRIAPRWRASVHRARSRVSSALRRLARVRRRRRPPGFGSL